MYRALNRSLRPELPPPQTPQTPALPVSLIPESAQAEPTPTIGAVWARGQGGQNPQTSGISCQGRPLILKRVMPWKISRFLS